ncbi:hypothetical protein N806_25290 [Rhodococcus sp. P27]|nr:hypothetical protein N806_25290 [Rhodococcus sp. P27]
MQPDMVRLSSSMRRCKKGSYDQDVMSGNKQIAWIWLEAP